MKNTQKFVSLAGTLNIGVALCMVITGLAVLACLVVPLLSVLQPGLFLDDTGMVSGSFEINSLRLHISGAVVSFKRIQTFLFSMGFFGGLSMALVLFMEKQIHNVLKCVHNEKPFDALCITSVKVLGYCIIGGSVLWELTKNLSVYLLYRMLELDTVVIESPLFTGSFEGAALSFSVNVSILGIGIIVLLLSYVFEYGSYLQSEYDATL